MGATVAELKAEARERALDAWFAAVDALDRHPEAELPYEITRGVWFQVDSARQRLAIERALTEAGFTFGDTHSYGGAASRTASRDVFWQGKPFGQIYGHADSFLPSDAATFGLMASLFGRSKPKPGMVVVTVDGSSGETFRDDGLTCDGPVFPIRDRHGELVGWGDEDTLTDSDREDGMYVDRTGCESWKRDES